MSSRWRQEFGILRALWRRDMIHLLKEKSRWFGIVAQPLLFWFIFGSGLTGAFNAPGHEGMSYLQYFYPGALVMLVLFTTIFSTISIIEDRQSGFLQGVLVAPGSRASMVAGKVAGVTTIALIQTVLFMALAPFAEIPYAQVSWPALFLVVALGCAGLTSAGYFLAWALDSSQSYHAVMGVVLIPLWIVSGAMFPARTVWLRVIYAVNPMSYMVDGARHAMAADPGRMPGVSLGTSLLVLAMFTLAGVSASIWVSRRSSRHRGRRD